MARLQNTAMVGVIYLFTPRRIVDEFHGRQNLVEEEALRRHEEEKKKESK